MQTEHYTVYHRP